MTPMADATFRRSMEDDEPDLRAALAASEEALRQERMYRLAQDAALAQTLDEVVDRSVSLAQHIDEQSGCSSRPVDLGHPQRLQDYATGLEGGYGSHPAEPALSHMWVTTPVAATTHRSGGSGCGMGGGGGASASACEGGDEGGTGDEDRWLGPTLVSRSFSTANMSAASASARAPRKRGGDDPTADDGEGRDKRVALLAARAEAETARADAACDVLAKLVARTGPHHNALPDGRRLGYTAERGRPWIESCEAQLLAWVEEQRQRQASADLRELRVHAAARDAAAAAAASFEAERERADRAESRARRLVGALRSSARDAVDEEEAALQRAPLGLHRRPESRLSARWEQQRPPPAQQAPWRGSAASSALLPPRAAAEEDGAARPAPKQSRQRLRYQLAMPGMPATLVAGHQPC